MHMPSAQDGIANKSDLARIMLGKLPQAFARECSARWALAGILLDTLACADFQADRLNDMGGARNKNEI
jgi:hypothetical protein